MQHIIAAQDEPLGSTRLGRRTYHVLLSNTGLGRGEANSRDEDLHAGILKSLAR